LFAWIAGELSAGRRPVADLPMCAPGHQPSDGSRESCFKDRSHSFEFEEAAGELWSILFSEVRPKGHGLVAGK